jgi:hypothetical protein
VTANGWRSRFRQLRLSSADGEKTPELLRICERQNPCSEGILEEWWQATERRVTEPGLQADSPPLHNPDLRRRAAHCVPGHSGGSHRHARECPVEHVTDFYAMTATARNWSGQRPVWRFPW